MRTRGVTLVEVLIVSGVLVVLAAVVFVLSRPARARGREVACISQLRQIHSAIALYDADNPPCDPLSQHLGVNAWPLIDGRHFLQLTPQALRYCPETPDCAKRKLLTSYQLPLGVTFPIDTNHVVFKQVERQVIAHGPDTALLRCFVHDELHHVAQSQDVSYKFYKPNAIELLANGSAKMTRIDHPRLTMIKDACQ